MLKHAVLSTKQVPLQQNTKYMGFSFNFFGTQEVHKFSYKPRFYDPEKEERRKRYARYGKQEDAEEEAYTPGKYVKGSLRDGNYSRTEEVGKNQKIIGVITTILLFAVIYLIYKYFPILIDSLMK